MVLLVFKKVEGVTSFISFRRAAAETSKIRFFSLSISSGAKKSSSISCPSYQTTQGIASGRNLCPVGGWGFSLGFVYFLSHYFLVRLLFFVILPNGSKHGNFSLNNCFIFYDLLLKIHSFQRNQGFLFPSMRRTTLFCFNSCPACKKMGNNARAHGSLGGVLLFMGVLLSLILNGIMIPGPEMNFFEEKG